MSLIRKLARTIVDQDTALRRSVFEWFDFHGKKAPGSFLTDRECAAIVGFAAHATGFTRIFAAPQATIYLSGNFGSAAWDLRKPSSVESRWSFSNAEYLGNGLSAEGVDALGYAVIAANDGTSEEDVLASTANHLLKEFVRQGGASFSEVPEAKSDIATQTWHAAHREMLDNGTKEQRKKAEEERKARLEEERKRIAEEMERKRLEDIEHERQLLLAHPEGAMW